MASRRDLHERLTRNEEVKGPSERQFGLTFAAVFVLLAAFSAWRSGDAWPALLALAVAFLGPAAFAPRWLRPLNRLWLRFGLALHFAVAPIVMGFLFFVVITPFGVIARLAGKDFLHLRFDREATTYWIDRRPPGPSPETMRNQF